MIWLSKNIRKETKGFTLIEILVYMALLVLICAATITLLVSMSDSLKHQKARQLVTRNATPVLERFLSDIRSAGDVDQLASTLETSPGAITLVHGATRTTYSVVDGIAEIAVNGTTASITDATVTVGQLRFYVYENANTEFVRILLTLSATAGDVTYTETFITGAVLRGSYE